MADFNTTNSAQILGFLEAVEGVQVTLTDRAPATYTRAVQAPMTSHAKPQPLQAAQPAGSSDRLTMEVVSRHASRDSCWIVLEGKVLDVTPFIALHPGGAQILVKHSGKDATAVFKAVGHSSYALKELQKYTIGNLAPTQARL